MGRKPVLPSSKIPGLVSIGHACLPPPLRLCAACAESFDTLYQTGEGRTVGAVWAFVGKYRPLYSPAFSLQSRHGRASIETAGTVDRTPAAKS